MFRNILAVCLALPSAAVCAELGTTLQWSLIPPCTASPSQSGPKPKIQSVSVSCDDPDVDTGLDATVFADTLEVRAEGQHFGNASEYLLGADLTAFSVFTAFIGGGSGEGFVTFKLDGGTSTGSASFTALGETVAAFGEELEGLFDVRFTFGKPFEVRLSVASSINGTAFADAVAKLEGIVVTNLAGDSIPDAQLVLAAIPEPASFVLVAAGLGALAWRRKSSHQQPQQP